MERTALNKNRAFLFFLILITLESIPAVLLLDWEPSEPRVLFS